MTTATAELLTVREMAARVGMSRRTLQSWFDKAQIEADGKVRGANGVLAAGFDPIRVEEFRAMHEDVQARKRASAAKRAAKVKAVGNKLESKDADYEAGIRRVVQRAWLEGSLGLGSPFYDSPDLPYPDTTAAEAAERTTA